MGVSGSLPDGGVEQRAHRSVRWTLLAGLLGLAAAVVLWGGYSRHWPWTGINGGTATLWDWLHLLLLPLVCAFLPSWVRPDTHTDPRVKKGGFTGLGIFAAVVVAGYMIPWDWTGFRGNTLWDWLELAVLPLTLILIPLLLELRPKWRRRHTAIAATGLSLFAVIVACGYLVPWSWTGFTGNTLWDWLHLLLLPLLLPAVVIPALTPIAAARSAHKETEAKAQEPEAKAQEPAPDPRSSPAEHPPTDSSDGRTLHLDPPGGTGSKSGRV